MTHRELPADLSDAFKSIAIAVLEWNLKDGSFYHSDSFERFAGSGMTPAELSNLESSLNTVYPADRKVVRKMGSEILASPRTTAAIIRLLMKDGTFHWARTSVRLTRDEKGVPERIVATLLDIHDLVQEKRQLAAAHSQLDHIISTISSGICIYSLENTPRLTFISDRALQIFGLTREKFSRMQEKREAAGEEFHPAELLEKALEALQGRDAGHIRFKTSRCGGSCLWLDINCVVNKDADQSVYLTMLDVTDQVRREEKLRWKEERYRLLSESSDVVTIDYNPAADRYVYSVNAGPLGRHDQVIHNFMDTIPRTAFIHPDDFSAYRQTIEKALSGLNGSIDCRIDFYGTGYRYYRLKHIGVADPSGHVSRVVGRADDIEEEHRRALALQEHQLLLQKVLKKDAVIAMAFDAATKKRISTPNDILPEGFPSVPDLSEFVQVFEQLIYPADCSLIPSCRKGGRFSDEDLFQQPMEFDCRFKSPGRNFEGYHWIHVMIMQSRNEENGDSLYLVYGVDIHKKKLESFKLLEAAQKDPLTGLLNISAFRSRCDELHENNAALQPPRPAGFALVKLEVRDSKGGLSDGYLSDETLQRTADTFTAMLQEKDACARLGCGLFALYVGSAANEKLIGEKIRILHSALSHRTSGGNLVTVSIGALLHAEESESSNSLFTKADHALLHARMLGGNRIVFYSPERDDDLTPDRLFVSSAASPVTQRRQVYIRTFGYFDIFVDGIPVAFTSAKAKELLALLVDRRGGFLPQREAIACLWENETADVKTMSRYRKIAMRLKKTLAEYRIEDILENRSGQRRVNPQKVDCDLYDYLSGRPEHSGLFKGTYMLNYSWAETMLSDLQNQDRTPHSYKKL